MTSWRKYIFMGIFVRVCWAKRTYMRILSSFVWIFIIRWFRRISNWRALL